jgi:hypothetical protein
VARIVLPSSGHTLLARARDWNRLVLAFAQTQLAPHTDPAPRYAELIADAFSATGAEGLQRVLAPGGRIRE